MNDSQVTKPVFLAPLLHLCPRNLLSLVTISLLPLPLFRYFLEVFFFFFFTAHPFILSPSSPLPCSSCCVCSTYFSHPQPDLGFPGGSVVKNSAANSGEAGWIPGSGRFPGEGNGNPFHSSCLGNPMNRGARWAVAHGVAKESDTTE